MIKLNFGHVPVVQTMKSLKPILIKQGVALMLLINLLAGCAPAAKIPNTPTSTEMPTVQPSTATPEPSATSTEVFTPEPKLGEFGFLAVSQEQLDWFLANKESLKMPESRYQLLGVDGKPVAYGQHEYFTDKNGIGFVGVVSSLVAPAIWTKAEGPYNTDGFGVFQPDQGGSLEQGGELVPLHLANLSDWHTLIRVFRAIDLGDENGNISDFDEYTLSYQEIMKFMTENVANGKLVGADIWWKLATDLPTDEAQKNMDLITKSLTDGRPATRTGLVPNPKRSVTAPLLFFGLPVSVFEAHPEMLEELKAISAANN